MEWNTIPFELLERLLLSTASPKDLVNACRTCKNWYGVAQDQHLWKILIYEFSLFVESQLFLPTVLTLSKAMHHEISSARISESSNIDWKKKVLDQILVRDNVKLGRCVVRTLAATQGIRSRTTLELYNSSVYKDYFLGGWLEMLNHGSYGGVSRLDSHVINMVTEEVTTLKVADLVFLNHYIANSSSSYYSGADYQRIQLQHFDPKKIQSYSSTNNVRLPLGDIFRSLIENHCPESNYIAFCEQVYGSAPKLVVMNAESNTVAYSLNSTTSKTFGNRARLYDHYLAISPENLTLEVIDIITNKKITRVFQQNYLFGFMTADTIVVHTRDELRPTKEAKIILWNFKDETEVVYPAGQVASPFKIIIIGPNCVYDKPFVPITMIYNDMWLVFHESKLAFFDMKDGTAINTLTLRDCHGISISLLSDGRLGLAQQSGCRVISFIDSEVNRKIKVKVMDIKGNETSHEISAHELPKFFVNEVKKPLEMIISRVVSYTSETATPPANDERFVLIFSQDEKNKSQPVNETATKLLGTATKPTNLHTPIQAWKFDEPKILNKDYIVDRVCGKAIIAREKKIDGRWQLISLN